MEQKSNSKGKIIAANASIAAIFWAVGIVFTLLQRNIGMLINFGYIGTSIGIGFILYAVLPR